MSSLLFVDAYSPSQDARVVQVPPGISTPEALLECLRQRAGFPSYFGANWNALSDCLRDLHWVDSHELVLQHGDLPSLPSNDKRTYLEVLAECVESWQVGEEHKLTVVFPTAARDEILRLLATP